MPGDAHDRLVALPRFCQFGDQRVTIVVPPRDTFALSRTFVQAVFSVVTGRVGSLSKLNDDDLNRIVEFSLANGPKEAMRPGDLMHHGVGSGCPDRLQVTPLAERTTNRSRTITVSIGIYFRLHSRRYMANCRRMAKHTGLQPTRSQ